MANEEKVTGNGHVAIQDWDPVDERGHQKNSREIEQDIGQTRHSMDVILDALGGKMHPRSLIDHFFDMFQRPENRENVKNVASSASREISEMVQKNPIPLAMIGAGAAWLLYERQSSGHKKTPEQEQEGRVQYEFRPQPENRDEGNKAQGTKEKLEGKFSDSKDAIGQKGKELRGEYSRRADDLKHGAQESYQKGMNQANQVYHENPLAIGAAALAIGVFAGMLIPESRQEKELMGEKVKKTMDSVRQTGENLVEEGKDIALDVGNRATQEIEREGLTPEQLAEKADRASHDKGTMEQRAHQEEITPDDLTSKISNVAHASINQAEDDIKKKKDENKG